MLKFLSVQKDNMNKRYILFTSAVLFSFLIFFLSCRDTSTETGILEVSGLIEAVETEIRPEVAGQVIDILVKEGQRVEKGQLLCQIDDKKIKIQIKIQTITKRSKLHSHQGS